MGFLYARGGPGQSRELAAFSMDGKRTDVTELRECLRTKLGFRFGANGPHAALTMMLAAPAVLFVQMDATCD